MECRVRTVEDPESFERVVDEYLRNGYENPSDREARTWGIEGSRPARRAFLWRPDWGSLGIHILLAVLTVWWTFGLGNFLYAIFRLHRHTDRVVVSLPE